MFLAILFTLIISFIWLISLSLCGFVIHYIKTKPIGRQSIMDSVCLDIEAYAIVWVTLIYSSFLVSILEPNAVYELRAFIVITFQIISTLAQCSVLISLLLKAVIVFRQSWIADVSEEEIVCNFRRISIFLALIFGLFDQLTQKGPHAVMIIMTRDTNSYR